MCWFFNDTPFCLVEAFAAILYDGRKNCISTCSFTDIL